MLSRYRKLPTGFSRLKMIVWSSGVSMPETGSSAVLALPFMPLMTPLYQKPYWATSGAALMRWKA